VRTCRPPARTSVRRFDQRFDRIDTCNVEIVRHLRGHLRRTFDSLEQAKEIARRRAPKRVHRFIEGGIDEGQTVRANRPALATFSNVENFARSI
jgi:hypothetical protein